MRSTESSVVLYNWVCSAKLLVETFNPKIERLPASRFPDPAEVYFCDNCGRDLTKYLHQGKAHVWRQLAPAWFVCRCGRKYLSGAAEWDNLSNWEQRQRVRQLGVGLVLFALLSISCTLAYFGWRHRSVALLALLAIALIPSIVIAKLFGFVLLDTFETAASIWRSQLRSGSLPSLKRTRPLSGSNCCNIDFSPIIGSFSKC